MSRSRKGENGKKQQMSTTLNFEITFEGFVDEFDEDGVFYITNIAPDISYLDFIEKVKEKCPFNINDTKFTMHHKHVNGKSFFVVNDEQFKHVLSIIDSPYICFTINPNPNPPAHPTSVGPEQTPTSTAGYSVFVAGLKDDALRG